MDDRSKETADPRASFVTALKVADLSEGRALDAFAYSVTLTKGADRRSGRRRRTRLNSGKLLDPRNGFLIECQIYDRSENGARVRIFADIAPPNAIRLYEDCPERLVDARVIWRNGRELGLRFVC